MLFESRKTVWAALNDYAAAAGTVPSGGKAAAGFASSLIVPKGMFTPGLRGQPYVATYTFDQAALALPGTKMP